MQCLPRMSCKNVFRSATLNLSKQDETILSIIENQSNRTSQAIQDEVVRAKNAEAQISGDLQDLVNVTEQDIQRNISI